MAAIDDLISQVEDEALRVRLRTEARRLTKEKKFGLVFEEHLPEITPIYTAPIRKGSRVAIKGQPLEELWRVLSVKDGRADCLNPANGQQQSKELGELVVVKRFGEPIFPYLMPMACVKNGRDDTPWHMLIEADNYHALQLLEYLYAGKVDCIYIDPPYNTGARDWKYNNDFVDENDRWRHSKWLAFIQRRLLLAKRLLRPDQGVLAVTIDEHEVHHLGALLRRLFPEARCQMITVVNNAAGVSQGGFYRVEEYIFFCFFGTARPVPIADDLLSDETKKRNVPIWFSLIRYGGINALPSKRPGLVYPIAIDPSTNRIVATGDTLMQRINNGEYIENLDDWRPDTTKQIDDFPVVWPFRGNGSLSTWQLKPETLVDLASRGFVRVRPQTNGPGGNQWSISYIKSGNQAKIERGEIPVLGRENGNGPFIIGDISPRVVPKTVWRRTKHDAGKWGSRAIREILGNVSFDYAKSPYVVRDTLATIVGDRPNALILDFFAGSGTTLHATEMLNLIDQGRRQCILVTNNEVSESDAALLREKNIDEGDNLWQQFGVCQSVTWPRCKFTILGQRDTGVKLKGEYLTGRMISRQQSRTYRRLGFIDPDTLNTAARKKEIAGVIDGIPTSAIERDTVYFVSDDEKHTAAILFEDSQADAFLEALDGHGHITHFYIVTHSASLFQDLKAQIDTMLGQIEFQEEEKQPLAEGFSANIEYFKLGFLEKDQVALGRQFQEILPMLWLKAGAIGPRPLLPPEDSIPALLAPPDNPFVVLLNETRFADLLKILGHRNDVTHVFLVTDSEEGFREMAARISAPHIIQLYRDYLENFAINKGHYLCSFEMPIK